MRVPDAIAADRACPDVSRHHSPAGDGLWPLRGMEAGLRVHQGGSGEPVLPLLHGLGATGDVWQGWRPLLARRWPGRWLAPDLSGHGGSPPLSGYTFQSLAAAVAGIAGAGARAVAPGHSLGGVVGLALAGGGFDVPVQAVMAWGSRSPGPGEELDRARAAARRPPAWFASRDEAAARYLRISGLAWPAPLTARPWTPGCVSSTGDGGWPWIRARSPSGRPAWRGCWTSRARALARGEHDPMNTGEQLTRLGVPAVTPPGLGHNAHVQNWRSACSRLDWCSRL